MIRLFYFLLWVTFNYVHRIYFRRIKIVNGPKEIFGRTIYVSNHSSAFMDPLVAAALRRPIVFFMTRSDVFTTLSRPFLRSAHMLPIYRQHDGEDTKGKNSQVFDQCSKILKYGRNLLIFSEGFTDDIFIRRLKPIKKGALRIGFGTLEKYNWKFNVYISAVGINYTAPNQLRSDLLIATSQKICLNDYKERYIENPVKTINDLTKTVELMMQSQITHVENKDLIEFHENLMALTGKGMHPREFDNTISLESRWKYSQNLADFFNKNETTLLHSELIHKVKSNLQGRAKKGIHYQDMLLTATGKSLNVTKEIVLSIVLFPLVCLNALHAFLPYYFIKSWVEKSFKRPVFWGSVKMVVGTIAMGILNIPIVIFLCQTFDLSGWYGFTYYLLIGFYFLSFIVWKEAIANLRRKRNLSMESVRAAWTESQQLIEEVRKIIPVV